ncbi:dihydrolipoamide acetyltransferase [Aureimonas sp. SA4125]|uniref:alpha/beta fold hydrolase n=1 Tax=Aureimonas sp. SA4125 TaxID=2826993 RepID=UPI001CC78239|nr:alpha/beta fold hydrolase [Aureimonas sp. SA4125]BDA85852.1 dihydrolipoamide acetyltransferase [Aureimonas sp. SA4125]
MSAARASVSPGPPLPVIAMGAGAGTSAIFLHGFGGAALSWDAIQPVIAADRPTLAFDLPGHGAAQDFPGFGPPKLAARAVIAELDRHAIVSAHLVGHSMGGAIAALVALFAPARVASLTLLAPGGFGPEIGASALDRIVRARSDAEMRDGLIGLGRAGWQPDETVLALHRRVRASQSAEALAAIFALLFRGGVQGSLPLDAVAATGVPVRLIWGREDRITPFAQSGGVPAGFSLSALADAGHMLMDEAPGDVIAEIRQAIERVE